MDNIFNNYILTNEDNQTFYDTIENILSEINNFNITNMSDVSNNDFLEINIEFQIIENNKYFKNCNEINNILGNAIKIKKNDSIIKENCLICMENYKISELKRELPICKHYFHKKCIDKWIKNKASCPICRDELIK